MNISDFCQEANRNPMFAESKKGLRLKINPALLKELNFVKADYQSPPDLLTLRWMLIERRKETALIEKRKSSKKAEGLTPKEMESYQKVMDVLAPEYEIGKRDPSLYSFMTIFRFIPDFNEVVESIRRTEGINPGKVREELNKKFVTKGAQALMPIIIGHAQRNGKLVVEEVRMRSEISEWVNEKFPTLMERITESCLKSLPFLFPILKPDFIDYVLYDSVGRISPSNLPQKTRPPELHPIPSPGHLFRMLDSDLFDLLKRRRPLDYSRAYRDIMENFDHFIVLKIYPDTPLSEVKKKLRAVQTAQKQFPSYKFKYGRLAEHDYKKLLGNLIFFYLRSEEKMTIKRANKIVETLGFHPIPSRIVGMEEKRIEKLLGSNLSTTTN